MRDPGVQVLDTARVIRHLGLRDRVHPHDAVAFSYPAMDVYEASAKRDREIHGNEVFGPYETEAGIVAVVSLRPQLLRQGHPVADPAEPDHDGREPQCCPLTRPGPADPG
jgi:hypothetical protein